MKKFYFVLCNTKKGDAPFDPFIGAFSALKDAVDAARDYWWHLTEWEKQNQIVFVNFCDIPDDIADESAAVDYAMEEGYDVYLRFVMASPEPFDKCFMYSCGDDCYTVISCFVDDKPALFVSHLCKSGAIEGAVIRGAALPEDDSEFEELLDLANEWDYSVNAPYNGFTPYFCC